jgi:hypothetical protein
MVSGSFRSSGGTGSGDSSIVIALFVLAFIVIRRMRIVFRGSKVSQTRIRIYSAAYFILALVFVALSFEGGGIAPEFGVVCLVVGVGAVYASYVFSDRRIGFWKGADGSIYYRGAVIIYMIYLAGLVARIAIELVYIGPQALTFSVSPGAPALSASAINAEIVTDILLSLGAGLLIGRNARVAKRYALIVQGKETVSDTPPKISLT